MFVGVVSPLSPPTSSVEQVENTQYKHFIYIHRLSAKTCPGSSSSLPHTGNNNNKNTQYNPENSLSRSCDSIYIGIYIQLLTPQEFEATTTARTHKLPGQIANVRNPSVSSSPRTMRPPNRATRQSCFCVCFVFFLLAVSVVVAFD